MNEKDRNICQSAVSLGLSPVNQYIPHLQTNKSDNREEIWALLISNVIARQNSIL